MSWEEEVLSIISLVTWFYSFDIESHLKGVILYLFILWMNDSVEN